ncbi:MAG: hypothetical protein V1921_06460 [Candidatus Altiarchaeota archaeon]
MTGTKVVKLKLEDGGLGDRLPKLAEDPLVKEAAEFYDNWEYNMLVASRRFYEETLEKAKQWNLTSSQVQRLVEGLEGKLTPGHEAEYSEKTGIFLSAIIQGSSTSEFEFKTRRPLTYLGFQLRDGKKITVHGDVGDNTGRFMESGEVRVKGNAGSETGNFMKGGKIIVEGDAKNMTGHLMEAGEIDVRGEAGDHSGSEMVDGTIRVGKSAGKNTGEKMRGGKIHVTGGAGDRTGYGMQDGYIEVGRDAGMFTGEWMAGGKIHVKGNVKEETGKRMINGEIIVDGDAGASAASMMTGGKISVGGDMADLARDQPFKYIGVGQIWNKGKRIAG